MVDAREAPEHVDPHELVTAKSPSVTSRFWLRPLPTSLFACSGFAVVFNVKTLSRPGRRDHPARPVVGRLGLTIRPVQRTRIGGNCGLQLPIRSYILKASANFAREFRIIEGQALRRTTNRVWFGEQVSSARSTK